jgi:hypothetical protein
MAAIAVCAAGPSQAACPTEKRPTAPELAGEGRRAAPGCVRYRHGNDKTVGLAVGDGSFV